MVNPLRESPSSLETFLGIVSRSVSSVSLSSFFEFNKHCFTSASPARRLTPALCSIYYSMTICEGFLPLSLLSLPRDWSKRRLMHFWTPDRAQCPRFVTPNSRSSLKTAIQHAPVCQILSKPSGRIQQRHCPRAASTILSWRWSVLPEREIEKKGSVSGWLMLG